MKPCAYYNEFDPYAAQWLRNLIAAGHIAPGEVDERSITEVRPDDLRGFTQCHFFAGIGGWSYALRLAGWADDRPVWTGSCPCQPFSAAGKQRGSDDERHLWPAFFDLIRECGPRSVFGEQVAGAAGYAWWDHVAADLEGEGYAAAAADIGAHSVGAPHLRQRLYWVANAGRERLQQRRGYDLAAAPRGDEGQAREQQRVRADAGAGFDAGRLANADGRHASAEGLQRRGQHGQQPQDGGTGDMGHADPLGSPGRCIAGSGEAVGVARAQPAGAGADGGVGHAPVAGPQGRDEPGQRADAQHAAVERAGAAGDRVGLVGNSASGGHQSRPGIAGVPAEESGNVAVSIGSASGRLDAWADLEWLQCSDGKARPTQPGVFPLVDGVRDGRVALGSAIKQPLTPEQAAYRFNRVGTLRGAGNAIVPHLAAAFVRAAA